MSEIEVTLPIVEITQVGHARRYAMSLAEALEFSEELTGTIGIVVSEIATNLIKHADKSGELLIKKISLNGRSGIEILALDLGPGISNISNSMQDGVSTSNTQGIGLGGIKRLSTEFDIYSQPGKGTALVARVLPRNEASPSAIRIGAISTPVPGETKNGDNWSYGISGDNVTLMVVDGLGHGQSAYEAAIIAVEVFQKNHSRPLLEMFSRTHEALRHTRGAAMSISRIDFRNATVSNVGVGNIMTAVATPKNTKRLASMNGIVGLEYRPPKEFSYAFPSGASLIMCTDGIGTKWEVDSYSGLLNKDPALIAGILYRDFKRGKDDTTIVALSERRVFQ